MPSSHDPEHNQEISAVSNMSSVPSDHHSDSLAHNASTPSSSSSISTLSLPSPYYPYPNEASFLLGDWYWNQGPQKSEKDFKILLSIIGKSSFSPLDVQNTNWGQIKKQLSLNDWDKEEWEDVDAGWYRSRVQIQVPFHRDLVNPGIQNYVVGEFYHRSLVAIIRDKLKTQHGTQHFHYDPYELLMRVDGDVIRLYGEIYSSPSFMAAHREVQDAPGEPGCDLPRVVVALMFWSDATHLTNFGNAKLWPLYLFFGNESKYLRSKPSINLCEHVAYFERLPDEFKDFASPYYGKKKLNSNFLAHCHRELIHQQWELILDDEFLHAYEHGLVIQGPDGITRRFYPRILAYSADYEEKALMAIHLVGTPDDRKKRLSQAHIDTHPHRENISKARDAIYGDNRLLDGVYVEGCLKPESLTAALNAFSHRLSKFGFNYFAMFLVDLMHEVEGGTWKATLVHLLRILESLDENLLHKLDEQDTIRRFTANTSELKQMAAWNYEDFLQCAIPVFEGLLPEPQNTQVMNLLFCFAHWHGLAKLRLHSDKTIGLLDEQTTVLGDELRKFQLDTCSNFGTRELPREVQARARRKAKAAASKGVSNPGDQSTKQEPSRKPKAFSFDTYKAHAIGDYAYMVRNYGTTDSYSTELGELEHRTPKRRYQRTSKKGRIRKKLASQRQLNPSATGAHNTPFVDSIATDPAMHHHIGVSENFPQHIGTFLRTHFGDPAIMNFFFKLKSHLLSRLEAELLDPSGAFSADSQVEMDPNFLYFKKDTMYRHKIFRINYTTYDMRRGQDTVNPNTEHRDIMLLSQEHGASESQPHQYRYARVIGIYHVNVIYGGIVAGKQNFQARRMEFLCVRWFELLQPTITVQQGWTKGSLDQLKFCSGTDLGAFRFVDPREVLRACHLIPRFILGKVHEDGKGLSSLAQDSKDWRGYYVNRFVDRDMIMRYHWGLGVGHVYSRMQTDAPHPDQE
ncbi:hypothetical protein Hypma_000288 [Hypsizygus marmoreus]|uniref:Uncharacterized protein n=1 Tax=Hypsizygus marmoreus TaxID=39966 RepID=A0A369J8U2_HYPMA|nr:hypothetical protein Hypma_000288 [Hypsizygus marmoreus]